MGRMPYGDNRRCNSLDRVTLAAQAIDILPFS